MRRLAMLLAIALLAFGCDDPSDPSDWEGLPDAFEVDNSMPAARTQRVNSRPKFHTLCPDGDEDWIRFRVTEVDTDGDLTDYVGPAYWLGSSGVQGVVVLEFRREHSASAILTWSGTTPPLYTATPGVYFLRVVDGAGTGGQYNSAIALMKDSGITDISVTDVTVPAEVAAGGTADLTVRVVNQSIANSGAFNLEVYVEADRVLTGGETAVHLHPVDAPGVGAGLYWEVSLTGVDFPASPTGPRYVIVKAEGVAGDSDVSNNVVVGSTLLGVVAPDSHADGADDTIAEVVTSARPPIVLGVPEEHTFYPAGDVDVIPLDASTDVATNPHFEIWTHDLRGGADTAIELLDDTGALIDSAEDGGMADGASYLHCDFTALPAGTYYIRVIDEQASTGAYGLSVRAGPMGPDYCEFDDDVETFDHIRPWRSIDTPVVGGSPTEVQRTFHLAGDIDWLVYSVTADGAFMRHMIDSVILGDCTPDFKLYEADGDPIKVLETNELSGPGINRITLTAGLYYIRVVDQTGTGTGSYKVKASVSAP